MQLFLVNLTFFMVDSNLALDRYQFKINLTFNNAIFDASKKIKMLNAKGETLSSQE